MPWNWWDDKWGYQWADDGFGNLIQVPFAMRLVVANCVFPAYEDEI